VYRGWVHKVAVSPDGQHVACATGYEPGVTGFNKVPKIHGTIKLLEAVDGGKVKDLTGQSLPILGMAFSLDSKYLATASLDQTVTVWDMETGREYRSFNWGIAVGQISIGISVLLNHAQPTCVAFSPDGKRLACGGGTISQPKSGVVKLFDADKGWERNLGGHTDMVVHVAFSPDGKTLASASTDSTALIWDVTKIQPPAPPAIKLQPGDLEARWKILAETDAVKAFTAIGDLTAAPTDTVPFLKQRLKPATALDEKDKLVRQRDGQERPSYFPFCEKQLRRHDRRANRLTTLHNSFSCLPDSSLCSPLFILLLLFILSKFFCAFSCFFGHPLHFRGYSFASGTCSRDIR
jgi:hypothetical protein